MQFKIDFSFSKKTAVQNLLRVPAAILEHSAHGFSEPVQTDTVLNSSEEPRPVSAMEHIAKYGPSILI